MASPQAVPSERDRTSGAIGGTRYLLLAAFASPSVRKIVLTSSVAAIAYGHPRSKRTFNEGDWTNVAALKGGASADYFRSKTEAERLAWEWANDAKRNPRAVPFATINPGFIMGPSLVPWARFSVDTFRDIVLGKSPLMVDMDLHAIDVRDCATMHIAVMKDDAANGHRHLAIAVRGKLVDIARIVRRDFGTLGYAPATRIPPQWVMWLLHLVSSDVASIYSHIGNSIQYQPLRPSVYPYEHCSLDRIVRDTMESLLSNRSLRPRTSKE